MKKIEVTDELLYKYMPIADDTELDALEAELENEEIIVSKKFEKKMKRMIWKEKYRWVAGFAKFVAKAAVVCLCILGLGLAVTMSVDAYRSKFFQTVQELLGDDSALHTYDIGENRDNFVPHEPTYIPEGFEEIGRYEAENVLSIEYMNNEGGYLCWDQTYVEQGLWNTLDTNYEKQVNQKLKDGILTISYYKDNYISAYYEEGEYVYIVTSINLSDEEIINIFKHFD